MPDDPGPDAFARRVPAAPLTDRLMESLRALRDHGGQVAYTLPGLDGAGIAAAHISALRSLGLVATAVDGYRWSPAASRYVRDVAVRITGEGGRALAAFLGEEPPG